MQVYLEHFCKVEKYLRHLLCKFFALLVIGISISLCGIAKKKCCWYGSNRDLQSCNCVLHLDYSFSLIE